MGSPITAQVVLAGDSDVTIVDNGIATVTLAAVPGVRHFMTGLWADYDIAVAAIQTITITYVDTAGVTQTRIFNWDFTNGPFPYSFPLPLHGDYNTAVTAALEASGSGGTSGTMIMYHFSG